MTAPRTVAEVIASASGREHRADPILPATGGPAGNAALTAWIGLVLLVLFLAELVTLLSVKRLISWHIAIGVLLIPPALTKTFSTGWRILRYYTGVRAYRKAGPPPLLLRLLGPLVVFSTLAVLGSGLALIPIGPVTTFTPLFSVAGQRISALTIHQASFIGWGVATGLHVLARTVPALRLAVASESGPLAGSATRALVVLATLVLGAVTAALVLVLTTWQVPAG